MTTAPYAVEALEDVIHDWVALATGIPGNRVVFVEPRDAGVPDIPLPAAQIQMTTGPTAIGKTEIRKVPSIVIQRITVLVPGPGTFGVDVYVGFSETPLTIEHTAAGAETTDVVAAGLLAELVANLPPEITAVVDPEDSASLIVTGSTTQPLFAMAPTDGATTSVTALRERFPELELEWSRLVYRVTFRSDVLRGFGNASDLMARAKKSIWRLLRNQLHAVGWGYRGQLLAAQTDPEDRSESQATYDFAVEGYLSAAYQNPAMRVQGEPDAEFAA